MTTGIRNDASNSANRFSPLVNAQPARALNNRLVATIGEKGCCDFLASIPRKIGTFFSHCYADVRMFFRAFSSMGSETTPNMIRERIGEVNQLKMFVEGPLPFVAVQGFGRLSPQVRKLFHRVDRNYVQELLNLAKTETVRQEIIRECDRVIGFQRQLTAVNTFYRRFNERANTHRVLRPEPVAPPAPEPAEEPVRPIPGPSGPTVDEVPPTPEPAVPPVPAATDSPPAAPGNWRAAFDDIMRRFNSTESRRRPPPMTIDPSRIEDALWANRIRDMFAGSDGLIRDLLGGRGSVRVPTPEMPPSSEINVNLEGTVPYVQDNIPADIMQKAAEINRLKERFEALPADARPNVPEHFKDIISGDDFMSIPVFDASHPKVQDASRGVVAAITLPGGRAESDAERAVRILGFRHHMDKDAMEAHLGTAVSFRGSKCPHCRHPEHGSMRRENLRIDTGLQDDELAFFRRHLPA